MKLKRILPAVLFILLASYLVATWYFGKIGQERIEDYVSQLNQQVQQQWVQDNAPPSLAIIDYKRGLFTSLITYELNFNNNSDTVLMLDNVSHGPWPIAALRQGIFKPLAAFSKTKPLHGGAMQLWFKQMSNNSLPWYMTSQFMFDGQVESNLILNKFNNVTSALSFDGATVQANYWPKSAELNIAARLAGFSAFLPEQKLTVNAQDIDWSLLSRHSSDNNIQTRQQAAIGFVSVLDANNNVISARQSNFTVDSTYFDSMLDMQAVYSFDDILLNDNSFGQLQLDLAANSLNYKVLEKIATLLDADEEISLADNKRAQLESLLLEFFASSPSFTLEKLDWNNIDNTTALSSRLAFRPVPAKQLEQIEDVALEAIDNFSIDFQLSKVMVLDILKHNMNENTVNFMSMLFDHYAARLQRLGLVVLDDGMVKASWAYENNLIDLNGTQVPMADFANRVLSIISP